MIPELSESSASGCLYAGQGRHICPGKRSCMLDIISSPCWAISAERHVICLGTIVRRKLELRGRPGQVPHSHVAQFGSILMDLTVAPCKPVGSLHRQQLRNCAFATKFQLSFASSSDAVGLGCSAHVPHHHITFPSCSWATLLHTLLGRTRKTLAPCA